MPSVRPVLLIDVDGVLNPLAVQPPGHVPPGFAAHDLEGLRVLLAAHDGAWLSELAVDFDLVWATSWEHDADRLIAERVGLPRGLSVLSAISDSSFVTVEIEVPKGTDTAPFAAFWRTRRSPKLAPAAPR